MNVHIFVYYKYGYWYCYQKRMPDGRAINISQSCNKQCDRLVHGVQSFDLKIDILYKRKVWNFEWSIDTGMV